MLGGLLRFYFFGEAINDLIKGSYDGLIVLTLVHLAYLVIGTIRHMFDTRTYTAIYTSLVTRFLSRRYLKNDVSKLSAHSNLAREFVDFLEHDLVYVIEAAYNILGSLIILFFYDKTVVLICLAIMIPVIIISMLYGKKMMRLNKHKNDEILSAPATTTPYAITIIIYASGRYAFRIKKPGTLVLWRLWFYW
jgi:ABC-type multidrug transport system fused ATPase/permease subunit